MAVENCDVAIIGAGTAGMAAERAARQAGAKTLLIDDKFAGTTCASVGCMPSKLLISSANAIHAARQATIFGINVDGARADGPAVMRRVQTERDRFVASVLESLAKLPAGTRIQARARFKSPTTLILSDGQEVSACAIVIATGAKPVVPKTFESVARSVLTNETIFELQDLPKSVAVMGAGPLGLELAQALARLGVEVRVFDRAQHLGEISDKVVEQECRSLLSKEISLTLGVIIEATPDGRHVRVDWSGAMQGTQTFEKLLVAAGRPPDLSDLNIAAAGIEVNEHGAPKYDPASMQCGESSIFIAGDADHDRPVLHEAVAEGSIAGRNAAAYPRVSHTERFTPLSIMFTDPQIAIVGSVPPSDAPGVVIGNASYADQGRAKMFARNAGIVHLYADAVRGRLIGASLVGPAVEHSAHLIAWAVQQKLTADQILMMPLYHPTYEEGLKPALRSICEAVEAPLNDMVSPGE